MGAEPKPEPVPVPVRPAVVVLVPFPAQGHVSPMLRLARALAAPGVVAATVAVPDFVHRRIVSASQAESAAGVALASIASGIPDDGDGEPPGFASILHAMEHHMPAHLEGMLKTNQSLTGRGVAFLVLDVLASWAVPVAIRCGVPAVGFWPAMLATYRVVAAIPELIDKGLISDSGIPTATKRLNNDETKVNGDLHKLPAELELSTAELPWLVGDEACQKSRFTFWLRTMERARSLRSILVNTFPGEAASDSGEHLHPSQIPQVLQVGPLPTDSFYRTKGDSHHSPLRIPSMWQADDTCMEWLDQQRPGTVTYVSFGSWVAPIGRDEIKELALGLEATGLPFLWALKDEPSWRGGLPSGYKETVADRGKIVAWAPQEDVLQHEAVGCYLTHCGWNSTLEAIQNGVRLLCCPLSSDQFINCAYIVKMWGIGIRLGSTKRSIVEDGIKDHGRRRGKAFAGEGERVQGEGHDGRGEMCLKEKPRVFSWWDYERQPCTRAAKFMIPPRSLWKMCISY